MISGDESSVMITKMNRFKITIILILAGVFLAGCIDRPAETVSSQLSGTSQ